MTTTPVHGMSNLAGPLLRGGDISVVAVEAIERDNPEKEIRVHDHGRMSGSRRKGVW